MFKHSKYFFQDIRIKDPPGLIWQEIKHSVGKMKRRWLYSCLNVHLLPFLELGTISCMFVLLSEEKKTLLSNYVDKYLWMAPSLAGTLTTHLDTAILVFGILILAFFVFFTYTNDLNLIRIKYAIYVDDACRLVAKYLSLNTEQSRRIGRERITSSIIGDCGAIGFIVKNSFDLLGASVTVIFYLLWVTFLSWKLALIVSAMALIPLFLTRGRYDKALQISRDKIRSQENILQYISELLNGFDRVKLDALEDTISSESEEIFQQTEQWKIHRQINETKIKIITETGFFLLLLLLLYGSVVLSNTPIATLTILFVGTSRMRSYMRQISDAYLLVKRHIPHMHRFFTLLSEMEIDEKLLSSIYQKDVKSISNVEMQNIAFSYDGESVLSNVNLTAQSGDRILIQGPSGQGKSTFLLLLCGLLYPKKGEVRYNNQILTSERFYQYRESVVYAAPTVYLFDLSLRDNLIFGHKAGKFTDDQIIDALNLAGLSSLVDELPKGLDTRLGANGANLSLGQRQRVILARIYIRQPSLLLLDEATSNLDAKLELEVVENLLNYAGDRNIVVMVAHKRPKNAQFNKHFILKDGCLIKSPDLVKESETLSSVSQKYANIES